MNALEFPSGRINAKDANAIQHFPRWQTSTADDTEIVSGRGIEGEHGDVMSAVDETLRYSLQQSLDTTHERSVTGRNVNDAQRPVDGIGH